MARDIDVNISLGASLASSFAGSLSAAQSQMRGLASSLRQAEQSGLGKSAGQREKLRGLAVDLVKARNELSSLRDRAQASGETSGYLARQIANAEKRVNTLSGSIKKQGNQYRGLIADMRAAGEATVGLKARQEQLTAQTFNMPMSFQVQGLDMPTFKARIQDCREDFAAIVRREVSAMQHQQQRTAYAR